MRHFFLIATLLGSVTGSPAFSTPVRTIHKLSATMQHEMELNGHAVKPIRFGLSADQMEALKSVTKGKVDFTGLYAIDSSGLLEQMQLERQSGFLGTIYPNVPPPGFSGDPGLADQWWIQKINAKPAWDYVTGKGILIADCDAGYYTEESDIAGNLLLDLRYDLADTQNPTSVRDGNFITHGTSVVAIMAGVLDGVGTSGIAFDAKVLPLQNFNYDSQIDDLGKEEATAKCILHALQNSDVKIIVLENQTANGSSETFAGTREAVKLALEAGVVIVSAGGNAGSELKTEEQFDTGSIIVGALAQSGGQIGFSNYGKRVSIAAFGENLQTLSGPNGTMAAFGGTSGATPQVAGAVALMLEINPDLTPEQVKQLLIQTRVNSADTVNVGGKLDVTAAVLAAKAAAGAVNESLAQHELREKIATILSGEK